MRRINHFDKINGLNTLIEIVIPGEGKVQRRFRSEGEARKWLEYHFGRDYKKLNPKFKVISKDQ